MHYDYQKKVLHVKTREPNGHRLESSPLRFR